jgi:hypothetical protein
MKPVWNDQNLAEVRRLAAAGLACSEIGEKIGMSGKAVRRKCLKEGIEAKRLTEAEAMRLRVLQLAADERRNERKKRRRAAEKGSRSLQIKISRTSALYRRTMFKPIPEMTKAEARAMFAEAVRNTAAMPVE